MSDYDRNRRDMQDPAFRLDEEPTLSEPLFDAEEDIAMSRLSDFMGDLNRWGLSANHSEMLAAIHVLQGFVIQHALQRRFSNISDWFQTPAQQLNHAIGDAIANPRPTIGKKKHG